MTILTHSRWMAPAPRFRVRIIDPDVERIVAYELRARERRRKLSQLRQNAAGVLYIVLLPLAVVGVAMLLAAALYGSLFWQLALAAYRACRLPRSQACFAACAAAVALGLLGCSDLPPRGVVTDQLVQVAAVDSDVACPAHGPCRLRKLILLPEIWVYGHKRHQHPPRHHGRMLMAQTEPLDPMPLSTIF